jgi:hypothetical protein
MRDRHRDLPATRIDKGREGEHGGETETGQKSDDEEKSK